MADKDMKNEDTQPENSGGFDINTDENLSGTTHLNEPVEEESGLEKLKAEIEVAKDKYLRKVA